MSAEQPLSPDLDPKKSRLAQFRDEVSGLIEYDHTVKPKLVEKSDSLGKVFVRLNSDSDSCVQRFSAGNGGSAYWREKIREASRNHSDSESLNIEFGIKYHYGHDVDSGYPFAVTPFVRREYKVPDDQVWVSCRIKRRVHEFVVKKSDLKPIVFEEYASAS